MSGPWKTARVFCFKATYYAICLRILNLWSKHNISSKINKRPKQLQMVLTIYLLMWENCHLKNSNLDYFCEFFKSQMWLKIDGLKMCRLYLFVCWIFWKNVRKLEVILGKINSLWKIYFRLSGSQTLTVKKGGRSVQQIQLFFLCGFHLPQNFLCTHHIFEIILLRGFVQEKD